MGISVVGRISGLAGIAGKVCRRMMSGGGVTSSSRISPWLMLRPEIKKGETVYRFYSVEEKKVLRFEKRVCGREMKSNVFVGSSHGWVALYNELSPSVSLAEPVHGGHIELPPLSSLTDPREFILYGRSSRVILTCSPGEEECRALMVYGPKGRLAWCVPGRSERWYPIESERRELVVNGETRRFCSRRYESCVYSSRRKTLFCLAEVRYKDTKSSCIATTAELEGWDLSEPESPRMTWRVGPNVDCFNWWKFKKLEGLVALKEFYCTRDKYLVYDEESDQLFQVVRHVLPRVGPDGSFRPPLYYSKYRGWDDTYPHQTIDFDVFKVDPLQPPPTVDDVYESADSVSSSLDGLAMFVGINHPFAIGNIKKESSLKPNSIYFTDLPHCIPPHSRYGGHDNGVFDYQNRTFSPCHRTYPIHPGSIKQTLPPPLWYTPPPMLH